MHRRESAVSRSCCCCPPVPKPLLPTSAAGAGREEKPCPPLLQRRRLLATSRLPAEEEVPRGRSAGHTRCAPRRPGPEAGSARPRPRSCAFRTGEPEARGAHAGDHGDGPRCRACTQAPDALPVPPHPPVPGKKAVRSLCPATRQREKRACREAAGFAGSPPMPRTGGVSTDTGARERPQRRGKPSSLGGTRTLSREQNRGCDAGRSGGGGRRAQRRRTPRQSQALVGFHGEAAQTVTS